MSVPMTFVILFFTNDNLKSDNRSGDPILFIFHISFVALLLQDVFYNVKCLYRSVRRKWQKNHRSVYEVADE